MDDDACWLDRTRRFLASERLRINQLVEWQEFRQTSFELVLHDLGSMATRESTLPAALSIVRPGGVLVLDDLQFPSYRGCVEKTLAATGTAHVSARQMTYDVIGRYSWVAFA